MLWAGIFSKGSGNITRVQGTNSFKWQGITKKYLLCLFQKTENVQKLALSIKLCQMFVLIDVKINCKTKKTNLPFLALYSNLNPLEDLQGELKRR